ncbi:MAG: hypothetical protein HYT43_01300 [Candidatus Taylorbacteria bacterium]|nr:hypothetical protein [Candidatus Taylorbacteria bacterium]
MRLILAIFLTCFFLFSLTFVTHAQSPTPLSNVFFELFPKYPRPQEPFTIEAISFGSFLSTASITWEVGGKVIERGVGKTKINLTAPAAGVAQNIRLRVRNSEGRTISGSYTLRPFDFDLIFEADATVPPFYRGKALYPNEGEVRVVALPRFTDSAGRLLSHRSLIYKWKNGDKLDREQSGLGANVYRFRGPAILRSEEISVEASTADGRVKGEARLSLLPVDSKVYLYEEHPLYGVRFEHILSPGSPLFGRELKAAAIPYFFGDGDALKYTWTINNRPVAESDAAVTVRRENEEKGEAALGVSVILPGRDFQFASFGTSLMLMK